MNIPRDFVRTWTAACKLYRGENKFRWPFQTRAGFASLGRKPLRHSRSCRICHTKCRFHTIASGPTGCQSVDDNVRHGKKITYLGVSEVNERLLVGVVSLLQVFRHEVAVAYRGEISACARS